MLKIERFTVEDQGFGCVTDRPAPRFSFALDSDRQNVALHRAVLSLGDWQCNADRQIAVPYAGAPLSPFTVYTAHLTAEDDAGERAEADVSFETGRLGTPWQGDWISDPAYRFTEKKTSPKPMTFRRSFGCGKPVAKARLYATAMGIYTLSLNGKQVGDEYFAPGLTSYPHTLQYQTYDVTALLRAENILYAAVGGGWAVGAFTMNRANRITADRQAFLCELRIAYADGTEEVFGTDTRWQVSEEGNYRLAEFYDGEDYDATVDLEAINWRPAAPESLRVHPALLAGYGAPVRAHEELRPVSHHTAPSGEVVYDFGQNFAGVIVARIQGRQGQRITFRHTELLMDGELYTVPLRTARAAAVYLCRAGDQTYSPRLTYMGFRYVGVTGIDPEKLELRAVALYSDIRPIGTFACSHPLLNRLQSNICWSARSNFMDIPTDCPQRDERMGWTGDIALFAPTACFNFDARRFLEKWLADVKAEQRPGGGINVVIPEQGFRYPPAVVAYWGDCCILVPWAIYRAYGDPEILRQMYPVLQKYLKAVQFWAGFGCVGRTHRHTWRWFHQYGDWVAPNVRMWSCMNRGLWTATACWSHSCGIAAQIARVLGREADAAGYESLKQEIDRAYAKRFLDGEGKLKALPGPFSRNAQRDGAEFQSGYVLPIAFGMLDPKTEAAAVAHLTRMVRESGYHIRTGFPGTPFLLFALADHGRAADAYRMLLQESCPSWLYEAKNGTTIWERWDALREDGSCNTGADDGTNGMTSFNHYASGAVGDFLYRRVAGIEPEEPGYRVFRVQPLPGGGLTYARGSVDTPYGRIVSDWTLEHCKFTLTVTVPVGTRCRMVLPDGMQADFGSGTYTRTAVLPADGNTGKEGIN